jgi:hypothetical protein
MRDGFFGGAMVASMTGDPCASGCIGTVVNCFAYSFLNVTSTSVRDHYRHTEADRAIGLETLIIHVFSLFLTLPFCFSFLSSGRVHPSSNISTAPFNLGKRK